jgi:AsmA protein
VKRTLKWTFGALVIVAVLAIAAIVALPLIVDTPRAQTLIATSASQALGRPVTFASVSLVVFPRPAVELHALEIGEDPQFGTAPFLKLDRGRLALRVRPLLAGHVEFNTLTLKQPAISLIRNPDGRLNVATLGAAGSEPRTGARPGRGAAGGGGGTGVAGLARVRIEKGAVTYVARGGGGALTRYRIEDLDLTLTAGSTLRFSGNARVKPGDLAVKIAEGRLALNGARSLAEAPMSGRVTVDGKDIAELVADTVGPATSVGGSLGGALTLGGTLGAPTATGTLALASPRITQTVPACPEPKRRTLALGPLRLGSASWEDGRLGSRPVTTSFAGGTISANLAATLDHGVRVRLEDVAVKALPLEKVLVDFLCLGYAVSGPLDLTGALAFGSADVWSTLSGTGQLRIGPGRVVGRQALALIGGVVRVGGAVSSLLKADVPASLFASSAEFDSITGTYAIANGVVTTRDLLYASRVMTVAVAGEYRLASGHMNLAMVVKHGRGEVTAKITGTAASPSIRVEPSTVVRGLDRKKVERGVKDLLKRFR